ILILSASKVQILSATMLQQLKAFGDGPNDGGSSYYQRAMFSRDGSKVVTVSREMLEALAVWDAASGRKERIWTVDQITPDVQTEFFKLTGQDLRTLQLPTTTHQSPDRSLVITVKDNRGTLSGADQNDKVCELIHQNTITGAKFSPDGTRFLTVSLDRML